MSDKTVKATPDQSGAQTVDETTVGNAAPQQEPTKKVNRRGVAAARGTQRLKFTHQLANPNFGLFVAHLTSVEVTKIAIGESTTGMPSFNGLEIPRLALTFASNEDDVNKRHYATISFTAVESNVLTIPGAKEAWKVNAIFDWLQHVLKVYVLKGREMTEEEEEALSLSFEDFDEAGEYLAVDTEEVIQGWTTLFENFENILNRSKDGKPAYKTADGKILPVWIKLIRHIKNNKKGWQNVSNGDLSFPTFVGEGCIEIWKQQVAPSIRVDVVRESIIPIAIEKAKSPNLGGAGGPGQYGGVPADGMGAFSGGPAAFTTGQDDDMPF